VQKPKIDFSKQSIGQDAVIDELMNYSSEVLRYSQARFDYSEVYKKKMAAIKAKVAIHDELATWYNGYKTKITDNQI
jgi:hypothetical protein